MTPDPEKAYKAHTGHDGFGIESIEVVGREVRYVNAGDTYDLTLVSVDGGPWEWSSYGDTIEALEREHEEETGEQACCYCGEWSDTVEPFEGRNWSGPTCEGCRER